MAGRRRGGKRKERPAQPTVEEDYFYPLGHPTGARTAKNHSRVLRGYIRRVNSHSSTSHNPVISIDIHHHHSPLHSINHEESHSNLAEERVPLTSSHHADDDLGKGTTNFAASTNSRCLSINITEIVGQKLQEDMEDDPEEDDPEEEVESTLEPGFVYVKEYLVKMEHAHLLRAIFERHGDITTGSDIKSPAILSFLLQHLCGIFNKLKEVEFLLVTITELENMLAEVKELESQKLNVRWLRERIERIINKKGDFVKYSIVKEEQSTCKTNIKRLEKDISLLQQQLETEKVKLDEADKVVVEIRRGLVDIMTTHSLVHGLL